MAHAIVVALFGDFSLCYRVRSDVFRAKEGIGVRHVDDMLGLRPHASRSNVEAAPPARQTPAPGYAYCAAWTFVARPARPRSIVGFRLTLPVPIDFGSSGCHSPKDVSTYRSEYVTARLDQHRHCVCVRPVSGRYGSLAKPLLVHHSRARTVRRGWVFSGVCQKPEPSVSVVHVLHA